MDTYSENASLNALISSCASAYNEAENRMNIYRTTNVEKGDYYSTATSSSGVTTGMSSAVSTGVSSGASNVTGLVSSRESNNVSRSSYPTETITKISRDGYSEIKYEDRSKRNSTKMEQKKKAHYSKIYNVRFQYSRVGNINL